MSLAFRIADGPVAVIGYLYLHVFKIRSELFLEWNLKKVSCYRSGICSLIYSAIQQDQLLICVLKYTLNKMCSLQSLFSMYLQSSQSG